MECKGAKAFFVIAAILISHVGQISASNCYDDCYTKCMSEKNLDWWCKYKCTLDCFIPPAAPKVDSGCSFACAKSSRGQIDTEGSDTRACLSTCSESCTKLRKQSP